MSQPPRDSGVTLIELLVTISLMGAMMAIAVTGWSALTRARAQKGAATELQSVLRQTQQRAVTEGKALCVDFDITRNRYLVRPGACDATASSPLLGPVSFGRDVTLTSAVFRKVPGSGPSYQGVTFYSRGTAWPGDVLIGRRGSAKSYTVHVEGLTGRVSIS